MIAVVEKVNKFSTGVVETVEKPVETVEKYTNMLAIALEVDYNSKTKSNDNTQFIVTAGRKYYRIEMHSYQKSIVCFVDKNTGEVYKPANWNQPAKIVRYNLNKDLEWLLSNADWAGGFLYLK